MNTRRHLFLLCTILALTGLSMFFYKAEILHWPLTPNKDTTVWTLEARVQFMPEESRPIKMQFFIPPDQVNFAKLDEHFVSRNYGVNTNQTDSNRVSIWSVRRAKNLQTLYYQLIVYPEQVDNQDKSKIPPIPKEMSLSGPKRAAAEALINTVRSQSADSVTFATEVIKHLQNEQDENVRTLLDRDNSMQNTARIASKILQGPKIRTRVVHGFVLSGEKTYRGDVPDLPMLAVFESNKNDWVYINPKTAQIGLPDNYLIWWYGEGNYINIDGGTHVKTTLSFKQTMQNSLDITQQEAMRQQSSMWKFSPFSLPLHVQGIYQIMIMIPLGAFIILLLRNLIGIRTFGTFMPVLVALAFRETQLISGLFMFSLVITLGLLVRFYLEHLKLLLVPRIACVLSMIVIIMLAISIISYHLGIEYGLSIALFPIVIMTMTVERMSLVWEERNPWEAIVQVSGSLFAASLAFLAMNNPYMDHLFFTFPELLLVLMTIMLLMGRYRGYRLSELVRFKHLLKS